MSFKKLLLEQQRLAILQVLSEAKGYSLNSAIIQSSLNALGLRTSRDQVNTELSWLSDQGAVSLESVASLYVATLNLRGQDVAKGLAIIPGVAQPEPGV